MTAFVKASYRVLGLTTRESFARRFGRIALAAIALAAVPSSGAQAAPFISDGVYEAYAENLTCVNTFFCDVTFGNVPVGKTLHLTHVSCSAQFNDSLGQGVFGMDVGGSPRPSVVVPTQIGSIGGSKLLVVNAEVLKLYKARSNPKIRLTITDNSTIALRCQIAGQLKP